MSPHDQDGDIAITSHQTGCVRFQASGFSDGFQREAHAIPKTVVPVLTRRIEPLHKTQGLVLRRMRIEGKFRAGRRIGH